MEEGETIFGDAVAIGGTVRIDGTVTDNAVAIGGDLVLGPNADVQGDAVVVGGTLRRDPGAQIGGKVVDVGGGNFDFAAWPGWRGLPFGRLFFPFTGAALGVLALMSTLARVALLGVLASLVVLVGREYVERVAARAVAEPVKAGAIGFLAQLLFIPVLVLATIVLVVTIIGIPLAIVLIPVAVLGLGGDRAGGLHRGGVLSRPSRQRALQLERSESLPHRRHRHRRADFAGADCAVDRPGRRTGLPDLRARCPFSVFCWSTWRGRWDSAPSPCSDSRVRAERRRLSTATASTAARHRVPVSAFSRTESRSPA